jgi:cyanophycinase-like exopeptidase
MTISPELMLAILSMDAYNREYGAGLVVPGTSIGNAVFKDHIAMGVSASDYQTWTNTDFYASAYKLR